MTPLGLSQWDLKEEEEDKERRIVPLTPLSTSLLDGPSSLTVVYRNLSGL